MLRPFNERQPLPHGANWCLLLLLIALAIVVRFPWFFRDVINLDEGTFILAGQALADGHLPYTLIWENKPPLGFAFFSAIVTVVPGSLTAIRLGGVVLVAASAFLVFRISLKLMPVLEALVSSSLAILGMSLLGAQGVMMEHVALVPLLGALLLLVGDNASRSRWSSLTTGILLGAATLIRLNLVYVAVAAVLATPFLSQAPSLRERLRAALLICAGGLCVLVAVYLPYGITGRSELFLDCVFRVPLAYATSNMGLAEVGFSILRTALPLANLDISNLSYEILRTLVWGVGGVGLFLMALLPRGSSPTPLWIGIFAAAALFSILATGHFYQHYLIQAVAFFAIGVGTALSIVQVRFVSLLVAAIVGVLSAAQLASPYHNLAARGSDPYQGRSFKLAAYLDSISGPNDAIFLSSSRDTLVYWLLKKYPVVPIAAHPLNIWDNSIVQSLYGQSKTSESILMDIVRRAPTYIVLPREDEPKYGAVPAFRAALANDYELVGEKFARLIFRKKP